MKKIILALIFLLLTAGLAYASFGVSLSGPSKIFFEARPNKTYDLAVFYIRNPGDDYGCYKMNVSGLYQQPQKRVPNKWIIYTPETFCLNPGEWQRVETNLLVQPKYKIDRKLKGDYFAFLEACTYQGGFGACAASKLYLTVN